MTDAYLTYSQLAAMGVSEELIRQWKTRDRVDFLKVGSTTYVKWSSVPERTRSKYSQEEINRICNSYMYEEQSKTLYNSIRFGMQNAYERDFIRYRGIYIEQGFPLDKVVEYSREHAMWAFLLDTYYRENGQKHPVDEAMKAYNEILPGKNYSRETFRKKIAKALKEGIPGIIIRKKGSGRPKEFGKQYEYMIYQLASDSKAFSCADVYRKVCSICEEMGMKSPKERTVNNIFREALRNTEVYGHRYGADKMRYDMLSYASIKRAEYANDQWQIDGWTMPFYYRDPVDKRLKTMCLFVVMDAYSKRIVGYYVSGSENTETILDGLEDAVRKTGELPFEIVSDNHSFSHTRIAGNFKEALERSGVTWTVSSNPRYKQVIERSFRTFGECYAKQQYGYTGQGIRSISPDARISQELFDKYMKAGYLLTEDQIKAIAIYCVDMWNNGVGSEGKSPNQLYEESERPNSIKLGDWRRCSHFFDLFIRDMSEITVKNGNINIVRAGRKYEYQLTSDQAYKFNNKPVVVKYIDLSEGVYMYDPSTGDPVGYVKLKEKAHGALANRTEEDAAILGKVSSINKAWVKKCREKLLNLRESADSRLIELVNQRTTPKDVIRDMRENTMNVTEFARLGGNIQTTPDLPVFNEAYDTDRLLREKEEKTASSPFASNKREKVDLSFLEE